MALRFADAGQAGHVAEILAGLTSGMQVGGRDGTDLALYLTDAADAVLQIVRRLDAFFPLIFLSTTFVPEEHITSDWLR